jgi:hypothetical protein
MTSTIAYGLIRYCTRYAPFTYTSDAASSHLLGLLVSEIDRYHQLWVFRDLLLGLAFFLMAVGGLLLALLPCTGCNTPYSLVSVGSGLLYFFRLLYLVQMQLSGFPRLRLMMSEVGLFQEFLDQRRLFDHVLPDLYAANRANQGWIMTFLFAAEVVLAGLGTIWVVNANCVRTSGGDAARRGVEAERRSAVESTATAAGESRRCVQVNRLATLSQNTCVGLIANLHADALVYRPR